jgi:hypothetical protein
MSVHLLSPVLRCTRTSCMSLHHLLSPLSQAPSATRLEPWLAAVWIPPPSFPLSASPTGRPFPIPPSPFLLCFDARAATRALQIHRRFSLAPTVLPPRSTPSPSPTCPMTLFPHPTTEDRRHLKVLEPPPPPKLPHHR